jgi:hypothetical protein
MFRAEEKDTNKVLQIAFPLRLCDTASSAGSTNIVDFAMDTLHA